MEKYPQLTRPAKPKKVTMAFHTQPAQEAYDELKIYLNYEGIAFVHWVQQQMDKTLPFYRTKYGRPQAGKGTG